MAPVCPDDSLLLPAVMGESLPVEVQKHVTGCARCGPGSTNSGGSLSRILVSPLPR
jgi:hypothetical protein